MTPELVVWVLIAGLIGLVWIFTCAILTEDRPAEAAGPAEDDTDSDHAPSHTSQRRVAA